MILIYNPENILNLIRKNLNLLSLIHLFVVLGLLPFFIFYILNIIYEMNISLFINLKKIIIYLYIIILKKKIEI